MLSSPKNKTVSTFFAAPVTIKIKRALGALCFFAVFSVQAQSPFLDSLQKELSAYQWNVVQEKIFVHTDKAFYLTGETLWYKAYVVDAATHRSLDLSKVVYVELLDEKNKPVLQAKMAVQQGIGDGSFILPASLPSGNYGLRAYTAWMKNFDEGFYFHTSLQIINTSKRPDWQALEKPVTGTVQFFPEGGNLVEGIKSKVGFQMLNQYGEGQDGDGVIVSGKNDTVVRFKPLHAGIGSFYFTPQKGATYTTSVHLKNGKIITASLPQFLTEGYVMQLTDLNKEQLQINVTADKTKTNRTVYLLAHTRQDVKLASAKMLADGKAAWVIDKSSLGDGMSSFTLFADDRQPLCERLYFKRPVKKMNITVTADEGEYHLRSKVNLSLFTHNSGSEALDANLSLSVFLLDSLQGMGQPAIDEYLWLASDIKGSIESPGYYFKNEGEETTTALDNLLLTQGWRRFSWEEVRTNHPPAFRFLPEYEGALITAAAADKYSGLPAPDIRGYLSVAGEKFYLTNAVSGQNGQLTFATKNIYGPASLVLQPDEGDSNIRLTVLSPYSDQHSPVSLSPLALPVKWKGQLGGHNFNAKISNAFTTAAMQRFTLPVQNDTSVFYGKPDNRYWLDEYTRFPTMEEVMREFIGEVRVRREKDKFHFDVLNLPYQSYFSSDPLVLLDGVPVSDLNKIISLDPLKVRKIEVVARKYFLGDAVLNGIVSYTTYDGNLAGFDLDPAATVLDYNGLQVRREFYAPVYHTKEQLKSREPDARNVLLWKPDLRSNKQGKAGVIFYTSDVPGHYAVVVQGITTSGLAGSAVTTLNVK